MTKQEYVKELEDGIAYYKNAVATLDKQVKTSIEVVKAFEEKEANIYSRKHTKASINEAVIALEYMKKLIRDKERLLKEELEI